MWHEYVKIYLVFLIISFIVSYLLLFKYLALFKINLTPLWDACIC